jgi:hypothetical protein
MRKGFWILVLVLCTPLAYGAADFSGTWVLDMDKSELMRMGRGRGGGGQGAGLQITLKIAQEENMLKIHRITMRGGGEQSSELKYSLDGAENTNPAAMGRGEYKAKATWDGEKLIIEGIQTMSTQRGDMEIPTKEVYSLSADGKVLTIETTRSTRRGDMKGKQVYNKNELQNQ